MEGIFIVIFIPASHPVIANSQYIQMYVECMLNVSIIPMIETWSGDNHLFSLKQTTTWNYWNGLVG